MKNNSKIMSNDVILHQANTISINTQIKMEKFYKKLKDIHNKLYSSYPDIEVVENIQFIYKKYNREFKCIMISIKNFYEYKSIIDFISEVERDETICWNANVYHHIKLFMDSWMSKIDEILYAIFLYTLNISE